MNSTWALAKKPLPMSYREWTPSSPLQWHHMFLSPLMSLLTLFVIARQDREPWDILVQQMSAISTPHCHWPLMGWPKRERCKCSMNTKPLSQALQVFSSTGKQDCQIPARAPRFWGAAGNSLAGTSANPLMHCKGSGNALLIQGSKCTKDLYHVISIIYFQVKYKYIFPTCLICNTDK